MRSPFVVALASLVPGLGFLTLGLTKRAVASFAITAGMFAAFLIIPEGSVGDAFLEVGAVLWIGQIYLAARSARYRQRSDSGEVRTATQAPRPWAPPGLTRQQRQAYKLSETLRQQLHPGEKLQEAIAGYTLPTATSHFLVGLFAVLSTRQYYVGATPAELVLLEMDFFGKPSAIERYPISNVRSAKLKKGWLTDTLSICIGTRRTMRLRVARLFRMQSEAIATGVAHNERAKTPPSPHGLT